jgi:transcriptional regulator with XRE-family HTH domain
MASKINTPLARRLDAALKRIGATQKQLAEALMLHPQTIYSLKIGRMDGSNGGQAAVLLAKFLAMSERGQRKLLAGGR